MGITVQWLRTLCRRGRDKAVMSFRPGLQVYDRLFVPTPEGEREIQLCLGDITHLPQAEKVDIVIVSAYPNDYAAFHQTLIGALKYGLGINVELLARHHKLHDLRKTCSCWISHPLPEDKPFRQLVCFERSALNILKGKGGQDHMMTTVQCVQGLFRALMPAFNNTNKSVIMPLLGTGMQHVDRVEMMNALVGEAIDWQRRGMPLQLLKIVLYSRDRKIGGRDKQAAEIFAKWKKKIETGRKFVTFKEPELKYDLLLIHSPDDDDTATLIKRQFSIAKVKVTTPDNINNSGHSQQLDMYTTMLESARVVPILSSKYLESEHCIDMYNLALCARRRTKRHLLAPLCLHTFSLPPHMTMVQWISCKDYNEEKICSACSSLVEQVKAEKSGKSQATQKYDVFVSYAHRNLSTATVLLQAFRDTQPKLRIFFDYDELKTGVSWQQTLYEALEQSRCVVALVSAEYLASPVCSEEFSIALARHLAKEKDCELIPVLLGDATPPVDNLQYVHSAMDDAGTLTDTAQQICGWLTEGGACDLLSPVAEPVDAVEASQSLRQLAFQENYNIDAGHVSFKTAQELAHTEGFVFLSYSIRDDVFAHCLKSLLATRNPNVRFNSKMGKESEVMHAENAACYVVLLSSHYIKSKKEIDEFNVILSKQRADKSGKKLMYTILVDDLPPTPTYFHLVAIDTALTDDVWRLCARKPKMLHFDLQNCADKARKSYGDIKTDVLIAMSKASCDLERIVEKGSYPSLPPPQKGVLHNVQHLRQTAEKPHVVTFTNDDDDDDSDIPTQHGQYQQKPHNKNDANEDKDSHGENDKDDINTRDENGTNVHGDNVKEEQSENDARNADSEGLQETEKTSKKEPQTSEAGSKNESAGSNAKKSPLKSTDNAATSAESPSSTSATESPKRENKKSKSSTCNLL